MNNSVIAAMLGTAAALAGCAGSVLQTEAASTSLDGGSASASPDGSTATTPLDANGADSGTPEEDGSGASDSGSASGPARDANTSIVTGPLTEVANCDDLPTPDAGWHDITPSDYRGSWEWIGIVVDPYDQSVYASAGAGSGKSTGIRRSTDCGKTWSLVSTGRSSAAILTGGQWAMKLAPRPDGPPTLYVTNGYGMNPTVYRSTNGGVDFDPLTTDPEGVVDMFVHSLNMDPNDTAHVAVAFHANCRSPRTPVCFSQSSDGGDTWHVFNGPAEINGWEEGASINILGPTQYLYLGTRGAYYTGNTGGSWTKLNDQALLCCYGGVSYTLPDGSVVARVASDSGGISVTKPDNSYGELWTPLRGSPRDTVSLIHDGENVFAGAGYFDVGQPYYTAKLSDLNTWTQMKTPNIARSPNQMAYDPLHHVVYSVNWGAGIWRLHSR